MAEGALVLDTHVWLWLEFGDPRLEASPAFPDIREALGRSNLLVSIISIWEVAILEAKGRIRLNQECGRWVDRALSVPGISLRPLTPEIAIASTRLPDGFHPDPADRMLVATARTLGATLATADHKIIDYGKRKHVKVLAV